MSSGRLKIPLLFGLAAALSQLVASYTWPDERIDLLEEYMFEPDALGTTPSSPAFGKFDCRILGAEWLRTAYHDMATADVDAGTGGLDASIGLETSRSENAGSAFLNTLNFFVPLQSVRSSMADLIAMAAVLVTESCSNGSIHIPYRAGRVDATESSPEGRVPRPEQDLETHIALYKKQGFDATEMIGLVACGHTIGSVHGRDFPDIVPIVQDPVRISH